MAAGRGLPRIHASSAKNFKNPRPKKDRGITQQGNCGTNMGSHVLDNTDSTAQSLVGESVLSNLHISLPPAPTYSGKPRLREMVLIFTRRLKTKVSKL